MCTQEEMKWQGIYFIVVQLHAYSILLMMCLHTKDYLFPSIAYINKSFVSLDGGIEFVQVQQLTTQHWRLCNYLTCKEETENKTYNMLTVKDVIKNFL